MDHIRFASDLPWFTAWASIFERDDLFPLDKLVYVYLCRCAGSANRGWPSYGMIARACCCTRRAAINAVNRLMAAGLIEKVSRQGKDGSRQSNVYTVHPPGVVKSAHQGGGEIDSPGVVKSFHQVVNLVHPENKKINTCCCSCGKTTGSNQKMTNDSDTLRQAVAELAEFTGEEPPQDVIAEMTRYDEQTIANAIAALRQYAGRNAVNNLYGYLLDALRGGWKPGPRVEPTPKEKPRPGPRNVLTDEQRKVLRSLYL
ncbi:MAG: Uncharacterized protein XD69_0379 [Clostridia bacterium 62_21]|nr:MAG: Uncharacterized protein XD69_0379 [Clostridia bacterium 62_21]